jgi:orotidine-5'-phosphate decarboxylase
VLSFGERLDAVFTTSGHLCLGIDPHSFLLEAWNLPDSAAGARDFGLRCVDVAAGVVGIVKPQVAFFERFGAAGYAALEVVLAQARGAGLLVIADAKRGDVGSTVAAYGAAWLTPGSGLEVDAMTVSAYQGVGSLSEVVDLARASGKGLFVLAATSNPESVDTQTAVRERGPRHGHSVAAGIVDEVQSLNSSDSGLGSIGVVIGATVRSADYGIDASSLIHTPVLAPGFGEQGAALVDLSGIFGDASSSVIANLGRSVLRVGPDHARAELAIQAGILATGRTR